LIIIIIIIIIVIYHLCYRSSGFNFSSSDIGDVDTFQKIVETFKFGYALRTYLGDETFANVSEVCRLVVVMLYSTG